MDSIIPYPGGKSLIASHILNRVPPHSCWVELKCGAAWATLAKDPSISELEIINDKYIWLVNFWRVIKHCPEEFLAQADMEIRSRAVFETYKAWLSSASLERMPDPEAAWAFWYLINSSFTGSMSYPRWKYVKASKPVTRKVHLADVLQRWPQIEAMYLRLRNVDIECLDFRECIERYDAPTTFFFVDPPYWTPRSGPADYAVQFDEQDHLDLADRLQNLQGRFLLTYEDSVKVRSAYQWAHIESIKFRYSAPHGGSAGESKVGEELIITNYDTARILGPLFAGLQKADIVL